MCAWYYKRASFECFEQKIQLTFPMLSSYSALCGNPLSIIESTLEGSISFPLRVGYSMFTVKRLKIYMKGGFHNCFQKLFFRAPQPWLLDFWCVCYLRVVSKCPNYFQKFSTPLVAVAMVSVSRISFFVNGARNLRGNSLNENLLLSSNLLSAPTFIFKVDSMLITL